MSGVPSVEPPSTFTSAVRSRASSRLKATWAARTTGPTLSEWLRVGSPTRTSTWPTAIRLGQQLVGEDRAHSQRSLNQKKS